MEIEELKRMKEVCLAEMRGVLPRCRQRLVETDERLWVYAQDVCRDDVDVHNLEEVLGLRKMLRMLWTYRWDVEKVRKVVRAYEALYFSGLSGRQRYPLTAVQCFMLACTFGPMVGDPEGEPHGTILGHEDHEGEARGTMHDSEGGPQSTKWGREGHEAVPHGTGHGRPEGEARGMVAAGGKRLVTDATYYIPRKFGKTTLSAFMQFWFFFFEDYNNEGYCVANSASQSSILFKLASDLVRQLDPEGKRIRFTKTVVEWKQGQSRAAKFEALSAGGKAKDGLFAGLCCADEYGSAAYVGEKSDMGQLVSVVRGSMGPRREPLTVTTTTAGRISAGPFRDKLEAMVRILREEMEVPLDLKPHVLANDWQFALLLQPDEWERDEDSCRDPRVWRKVNPHIGVTVQEDFYRNEWLVMDTDEETKRENLCKLFNVYQSDRKLDWVKPEEIRALQVPMRVDDCVSDEGWKVFVGMDFSMGNDLHAMSYLAFREVDHEGEPHGTMLGRNYGPEGEPRGINAAGTVEFMADMDAWISGETLAASPIRKLYERWIEEGWLHVSPGAVLQPELPVDRIAELYEKGVTFLGFGYDPYKAKAPINSLSAWVAEIGGADAVKDYILPVRQNYANYNPVVEELDYMIRSVPALLHFSMNPMWAWEFGNVVLDVSGDGYENKKPVKASQSEGCKVDNVQCLASALMMYDRADGREN